MRLARYLTVLFLIFTSLFFPLRISLAAESIEDQLLKINKANLPLSAKIIGIDNATINGTLNISSNLQPLSTTNQTPDDASTLNPNTAGQYSLATSGKTPDPTPTNFFSLLIAKIKDFFGFGNKKAKEYVGTQLPKEGVEKTVAKINFDNNLSFNQTANQSVLGIFDTNAMEIALPILQCANLPFGIGDCPNGNPYPNPSPTITSNSTN